MQRRVRFIGLMIVATTVVTALAASGPDAAHTLPPTAACGALERFWPCPADGLYGQPAHGCNDPWSAHASAIGPDWEYTCYENVPPIGGAVCDIHFFGLSLQWNGAWSMCDPADMVFEITFYAPGSTPGPVTCGPFTVAATATAVESCAGYDFYYFEVLSLSACCPLLDGGWVSVKSVSSANDCLFLWLTSGTGDLSALQDQDGTLFQLDADLSLCLMGDIIPLLGACCDDASGLCDDGVEMAACLGQGQRFQANTLCADLNPPCGGGPGACCYDDGTCRITPVDLCATLIGDANCDGTIDFNDINSLVEVLSGGSIPDCPSGNCDCNRDGAVDFADINQFVDAVSNQTYVSGTFLGFNTTCDQCPCVIVCPPEAADEGEPCHADTNGGCGSNPVVFGTIECGQTVCGTSWFDGMYRDSDWYRIEYPGGDVGYIFTLIAQAEFDGQLFLIRDDAGDCYDVELLFGFAGPCEDVVVVSDCVPAASHYYAWVGPQFTTVFDCTDGHGQYWITAHCDSCDSFPGACCKAGICHDNLTIWECEALGGMFLGQSTECATTPCPPGDTCEDPIVIPELLPFDTTGSTCSFVHDYDAICPYNAPGGPDVVYQFTPAFTEYVEIMLCLDETNYDTKLYVFEDTCTGTPIACNDDFCTTAGYPNDPYVSLIEDLTLYAGHAYYIVVDGYGASCGTYRLIVIPPPP